MGEKKCFIKRILICTGGGDDCRWNDPVGETCVGEVIVGEVIVGEMNQTRSEMIKL